uniref:Doublecortin family protein n=4 Tax=Wuchereria bancrofti TaxID=6293 RepID=A0AAF5Q295_WUCBA
MDNSGLDFNVLPTHPEQPIDFNYRGIRIKVYKNGDQYDEGTTVVICRKRFKHWLTFLDFLTKKLNLMAPVHEFYRTDGLRIRHFEEIENGGSYVAVSQGPFLHKPYGLLLEDREKWNINPKFESPEQSTLDSAESVDIYLKQRGYISRTGLPFPFDGGVCVNHSLMDLRRNRDPSSNLSIHQHHGQKPEENNSKNGELLAKNDIKPGSPKEELQIQLEPHSNSNPTACSVESPRSNLKVETKTALQETGITNGQNAEQNDNISCSSTVQSANVVVNKVGKNALYSEIGTQSDRNSIVKEYAECVPAPFVQIPDSCREFLVTQDAKNMQSLGTKQTMDPLPTKNHETVITIVSDDALVSADNSSVIIVNISTGRKKRDDVNNVCNNGNKSADDKETNPPLVSKVTGTEVSSESSAVKMLLLPDGTRTVDQMQDNTETKTPMAIVIDNVPLAATVDRLSSSVNIEDQRPGTESSKKDRDDIDNAKSSKINSKGCSDNVVMGGNSNEQENNLVNKFEKFQKVILGQNSTSKLRESPRQKTNLEASENDKEFQDTSKTNTKLNEVCKNLKESTSLSMQQNEYEQRISDNFEYDKENDSAKKSQSNHISVASGHKYRSKVTRQRSRTVSNLDKIQESSTTDKNSHNRKRVTLVTPSAVDMDLKMESGKTEIFSDSERQIRSFPNQMTTTTTSFITTDVITNTTTSNIMTAATNHSTVAFGDAITHPTMGEKVPNLQRKYQLEGETSFEADFTPRENCIRRNLSSTKGFRKIKIDLDLNVDICGLPTFRNYDPDFKDYDFMP